MELDPIRGYAILIDVAAKSLFLLLFVALLAALARRASAAMRHRLWFLGLAGSLLLIPLTIFLPSISIPILPAKSLAAYESPISSSTADSLAANRSHAERVSADRPANIPSSDRRSSSSNSPEPTGEPVGSSQPIFKLKSRNADPMLASRRNHVGTAEPSMLPTTGIEFGAERGGAPPSSGSAPTHLAKPGWVERCLVIVWLGIAATHILLWSSRVLSIHRGVCHARPLEDPSWLALLDACRSQVRCKRRVALAILPGLSTPFATGLRRPCIFLPQESEEWSSERKRVVLLHELAHVSRWDILLQSIGFLSCGVFWFQPLAWYALRRMRIEREIACDDCVLRAGERPSDYAAHLLELVRFHQIPAHPGLVAMGRRGDLSARIAALLDRGRDHLPLGWRNDIFMSVVALVAILGIAPARAVPASSPQKTASQEPGSEETRLQATSPQKVTDPPQSEPPTPSEPLKEDRKFDPNSADIATSRKGLPDGAILQLGNGAFRQHQQTAAATILGDSATVFVVDQDELIYYELATGNLIRRLANDGFYSSSADFSANRELVAILGWRRVPGQNTNYQFVKVLRTADGTLISECPLKDGHWEAIRIFPDGSTVVLSPELSFVDVASGTELKRQRQPDLLTPLRVAASPDGRTLACLRRQSLDLVDWIRGEQTNSFAYSNSSRFSSWEAAIDYSSDGKWLAFGRDNESPTRILDVARGEFLPPIGEADRRSPYAPAFAFSPDSLTVAMATGKRRTVAIEFWDLVRREKRPIEPISVEEMPRSISYSPDGKRLLVMRSPMQPLEVVDLETGKRIGPPAASDSPLPPHIRFLHDNRTLVHGRSNLNFTDVRTACQLQTIPLSENSTEAVSLEAMDITRDGSLAAMLCDDDTLRIWDLKNNVERLRLPGHGKMFSRAGVRFDPSGKHLVSWGRDHHAILWDLEQERAIQEFSLMLSDDVMFPHLSPAQVRHPRVREMESLRAVMGTIISYDASRILLCAGGIHIVDVLQGKPIHSLKGDFPTFAAPCLTPDNRSLLVYVREGPNPMSSATSIVSNDRLQRMEGQLQRVDVETGNVEWSVRAPEGSSGFAKIAISPDGQFLAAGWGNASGNVDLFDVATGVLKASFTVARKDQPTIDISPDNSLLACAFQDGTILVFDLAVRLQPKVQP